MSTIENVVTIYPPREMEDSYDPAMQPAFGVSSHFADEARFTAAEPDRTSGATSPAGWKAETIEIYRLGKASLERDLQAEVAHRLLTLTGREIPPGLVYVDSEARTARVRVDGVSFRLIPGQLVLLAPCAYCGVQEFESLALETRADLGYALSDWKPYCPDCIPNDPEDWD